MDAGDRPRRIAVYARVSTKEQNPETQLLPLREYVRNRGFNQATEYVDVGCSGATGRRPALDRLLADAKARRIDCVLVWKLDRLFRSTRHMLNTMAEFKTVGVDFISLTEQMDTSSPVGEAMFTVISAMGQLERDLIRERVKAGLERARAAGVRLGRPKSDVDAARVREVYASTRSVRITAKMLHVSKSVVGRVIKETTVAL